MEKLNYFTGEFSESELKNHFYLLDENKLRYELENFTNQYLNLSEEEQLDYVEAIIDICYFLHKQIDKSIQKKILEAINKILSKKPQVYHWIEIFNYFSILCLYLVETERYEEYSKLFENDSYFFKILDLILKENLEDGEYFISDLLLVFVQLFEQESLPEEKRIYFESKLEQLINFIF